MRISDWSSDVCSSDLRLPRTRGDGPCSGFRTSQTRSAPPHPRGWTEGLGAVHRHACGSHAPAGMDPYFGAEIGRASCRERVCQYVSISVVAVSYNKHTKSTKI